MILKKSNTTQHTNSLKDSFKKISITYRKPIKNLNIPPPFLSINKPPFLIAEIGGNHEGNFSTAKKMLKLAIETGVDCVKFQIYQAKSLVNEKQSPDRYKHFKKFELTNEQHIELAEICRSNGVIYSASVWDVEALNWIDPYLDFYKIGSGDLTAYPLIESFAEREKPIILSTGLSNLEEVLNVVNFIQKANKIYLKPEMLCLLQCTSMYPIPESDANLNVMLNFKSLTGLACGYSDHTEGTNALKIAANMGANILEFHFTDSRENKSFRDHKVSLIKEEVIELKNYLNASKNIMGNNDKKLLQIEIDNNHNITFRRGIYLKKLIKKGSKIKKEELIYLRPAYGTSAEFFDEVIGKIALKDIKPFEPIIKNIDY